MLKENWIKIIKGYLRKNQKFDLNNADDVKLMITKINSDFYKKYQGENPQMIILDCLRDKYFLYLSNRSEV